MSWQDKRRTAAAAGADLSGLGWVKMEGGAVADIEFGGYAAYATRMKTPPAFDGLGLRSPENNLFGSPTADNRHFTRYGAENGADHSRAEAEVVKMMNPMEYIGAKGVTTAPHWCFWPVPDVHSWGRMTVRFGHI